MSVRDSYAEKCIDHAVRQAKHAWDHAIEELNNHVLGCHAYDAMCAEMLVRIQKELGEAFMNNPRRRRR